MTKDDAELWCTQHCTPHAWLLSVTALAPHWPMHCSRQTIMPLSQKDIQTPNIPVAQIEYYLDVLLLVIHKTGCKAILSDQKTVT